MTHRDALNPDLARLLRLFNLDRAWARGEGVWLYDRDGGKFLDCYGQYAAVPLGHNAPAVIAAVQAELDARSPAMVQPYRAPHAVALAEALVRVAPERLRHCIFTTSGAETVEAAIKLVRARTGRHCIVSCEGAYHGKTLGAMAASGASTSPELYGPRLPGFATVPFGDAAALESFLRHNVEQVAAVFLEPVQGEGGVHLPDEGYLMAVRQICDRYGVAMVLDEIQTGLGRTGQLFACNAEGVSPDVLLLSKALGGGLFPLGACLASEQFWDANFALTHSSTFANNNIGCRAGLAVLEEITRPGFLDAVRENGAFLLDGLRKLARRHPLSIASIRGRGLLSAIELRPPKEDIGLLLSYAYHQNLYGYAFAATLAERHSVLVLPTLTNGQVIRISPPLTIGREQLRRALRALDDVLADFESARTCDIARALFKLNQPRRGETAKAPAQPSPALPPRSSAPADDGATFAFLVHCTSRGDMVINDPGLSGLSERELDRYCRVVSDFPPGVGLKVPAIRSRTGALARGCVITIGMLPEEMAARGRAHVLAEITRAVDLAADLGAKVVGLGAFTKIYSRHGKDVTGRGPAITTGNALTADMAVRAVKRAVERRGGSLADADIGLVGAMGSVGRICANLLARESAGSLMLVGSPTSSLRSLGQFGSELAELRKGPVGITTDLERLARCQVVLSASSAYGPILDEVLFESGTIICDVARPPDTGRTLRRRPDLTVVAGGLVALPDSSFYLGAGNLQGFPPGVQLACFSETALLALAGSGADICIGTEINMAQVDLVRSLAEQHGFGLAEPELGRFGVDMTVSASRGEAALLRVES